MLPGVRRGGYGVSGGGKQRLMSERRGNEGVVGNREFFLCTGETETGQTEKATLPFVERAISQAS
jgi:hypothetical protein